MIIQTRLFVWAVLLCSSLLSGAQTALQARLVTQTTSTAVEPAFEVATIKPSQHGGSYPSINTHLRDLWVKNASVLDLIKWSYRLRDEQIKGGPSWIAEMKFDIVAQPDLPGQPSREQDRQMMRDLLAKRFRLAVHETQNVSSVYALSLGDGQPRMTPSHSPDGLNSIRRAERDNGTTAIQFANTTMPDFLYTLMDSITDREIVDETGLKGQYDFTLIVPSAVLEGDADPADRSAALFKAVESMGLQLRRKKAPVEVIVIDRLEKPTPN